MASSSWGCQSAAGRGKGSSAPGTTKPPSTGRATPVMNDDSSLAKKRAALAISDARPQRFIGTGNGGGYAPGGGSWPAVPVSRAPLVRPVQNIPGQMQF